MWKQVKERSSTYLMNMKTPYDVLCSNFRASWTFRKEDNKDYTLDHFSDLIIRAQ